MSRHAFAPLAKMMKFQESKKCFLLSSCCNMTDFARESSSSASVVMVISSIDFSGHDILSFNWIGASVDLPEASSLSRT